MILMQKLFNDCLKKYIKTVLPMRKILQKRFSNIPASFWGEEEMAAQYNPDFDKNILERI